MEDGLVKLIDTSLEKECFNYFDITNCFGKNYTFIVIRSTWKELSALDKRRRKIEFLWFPTLSSCAELQLRITDHSRFISSFNGQQIL